MNWAGTANTCFFFAFVFVVVVVCLFVCFFTWPYKVRLRSLFIPFKCDSATMSSLWKDTKMTGVGSYWAP